jgi:transcriptional regulator with XRE-family HTH domain
MPKKHFIISFASFGNDIKEARNAINLSRRELAVMANIDARYLANIENSGSLPSLPVFYELTRICQLPV